MGVKRIIQKTERTPDEQKRIAETREQFDRECPSPDELIGSGEYNPLLAQGAYLSIREAVVALKKAREEAGFSLADISSRSGIDKAALSRLENGQTSNPTIGTLCRYARAMGQRWRWTLEPDTTAAEQPTSGQVPVPEEEVSAPNPFYAHFDEIRKFIAIQQAIESDLLAKLQESRRQAVRFIKQQRLATDLLERLLEDYYLPSQERGDEPLRFDARELLSLARHLAEKASGYIGEAGDEAEQITAQEKAAGSPPTQPK
jgi:transcriptional regulator with XRE-family HTH domain